MENQLVRAKPVWEGVSDLAPERAVPGAKKPMAPAEIRDYLTGEIARLSKQVERGLPPDGSPKERLRFAGMLVNLDRATEAEELLRRLPPEPEVLLALGDTIHRQGRFRDSDDTVRPLLDAEAPSLRRAAYEQLARNASARHENAEVARLLTEAAEKLPRFAAVFQFQLGRHYQQTGQPFAAIEAFDRAVFLDLKLAPATEPYRRAIREHTPGCLIGR
jgi:tetratricopeptide (TPR) repeat protein